MIEPTLEKVHEDERGAIYSITLGPDNEMLLIFSKKGALRGGHSHNCDEVTLLLSGSMQYHKADLALVEANWHTSEWTEEVKAGELQSNPAGIAHLGEFLEDSWLLDWRMGAKTSEIVTTNYAPLRDRIEASQ